MTNLLQKRQSPKDTLKKKQWSKYVSKGISLTLMNFNPKSKLFKSYKNSTYCAETLLTNDIGKIHTTYCKNRWCLTCNRIKTARSINAYLPQLETFFQPVFITLTLPTVSGEELRKHIDKMEKAWRKIYNNTKQGRYKKTHELFKGIRKAECTIRPNGLYHYHFHIILEGWAEGEWLIAQWLKTFPEANRLAQDIRFADEFSFKELFKYAFKAEVKSGSKKNAERYDLVFNALRGKKTIFPFGGIKPIEEDFEEEDLKDSIILEGKANRIFKWCVDDWFDKSTGEALIGLAIPLKVQKLTNYPVKK